MIRIVIENLLLFLLPTAMYIAYAYLQRRAKPDEKQGGLLDDAPLIWLFVVGAALVVVVLVAFGSTSGGKPGQGYTPPSFEGGKVTPGELK
jgi:hypothetical protein